MEEGGGGEGAEEKEARSVEYKEWEKSIVGEAVNRPENMYKKEEKEGTMCE